MKKKNLITGIISIMVIIGLALAACDDSGSSNNGGNTACPGCGTVGAWYWGSNAGAHWADNCSCSWSAPHNFVNGTCVCGTTSGNNSGGNNGGTTNTSVTFNSITANGSASQATTQLTLTFSQAIPGLTVNDITINNGINKDSLTGTGPTYTLNISGFTNGGTIVCTVAKTGFNISNATKTVTFYGTAQAPDQGPVTPPKASFKPITGNVAWINLSWSFSAAVDNVIVEAWNPNTNSWRLITTLSGSETTYDFRYKGGGTDYVIGNYNGPQGIAGEAYFVFLRIRGQKGTVLGPWKAMGWDTLYSQAYTTVNAAYEE